MIRLVSRLFHASPILAASMWCVLLVPAVAQSASHNNEVVFLSSVREGYGIMRIVMHSKEGIYVFVCNIKAAGCITPFPGKPYWLLTASAPVGKLDLKWLANFYVEYHNVTNVGIIPAWKGWTGQKDSMREYREVGAYALRSFTVAK